MEVEYLALTVTVERHNILAVGEMSMWVVIIPIWAFKINGIKLPDEIVREFLPVSHFPSLSLFRGWGQFDSYRRVLDAAMSLLLLPELCLMEHHPRPDRRGGEPIRQVTNLHNLSQLLVG